MKIERRKHYELFKSAVFTAFRSVLADLQALQSSDDDCAQEQLQKLGASFQRRLESLFELAEDKVTNDKDNPWFGRLKGAFYQTGNALLKRRLHHDFQRHMADARFTPEVHEAMRQVVDMRFPHEWFPATRALQRTVHVHVGPTNSGKTYRALKALEGAKSGIYAGPLRLLATEVYYRLMAKGHKTALITGEELRIPDDSDMYFTCCTVEMIPLNQLVDVAVIDEIQMLGDEDRGNAWTSAFLGVRAKEVHVCGEDRTVAIIQALCATVGDSCVVHRYERLSPLRPMSAALDSDYNKLYKGDAIVAFSRRTLHGLKKSIEEWTGRRCAIVYGALPPDVRVQQAALFNDPDNDYDFIAASDAIGMGLNLDIRRIIFDSVRKFDGHMSRQLSVPEIKQIGGRAGRYRTASDATGGSALATERDKVGLVTTIDRHDLPAVRRAMTRRVPDIHKASVYPPAGLVERFASFFPPGTSLSYIMLRLKEVARVGPLYRLDFGRNLLTVADLLEDIPLNIYDRLTFCFLPVSLKLPGCKEAVREMASAVAENLKADLLSLKQIPIGHLDLKLEDFKHGTGPTDYLTKLESLHSTINQYLWLSFRFPGVFTSQAMAMKVRSMVEARLIDTLERLNFTKGELDLRRRARRAQAHTRDADEDDADDVETDEEEVDQHLPDAPGAPAWSPNASGPA